MALGHLSPVAFSTYCQAISVSLIWMFLLGRVSAQNQPGEVETLIRFRDYNSLLWGGVYWSSWNKSDLNTCTWAGVTCTSNHTVWELDLSEWALAVDFKPREVSMDFSPLSDLKDLRQLDLSSNNLGDWFGMGNMTGLTRLDYSSNLLRSFPDDICHLTGLISLDLSFNSMSGPIPSCISACRSLQFISVHNNNLSGVIPSLHDLLHLQFLLLAENNLSGPFPKELGELSNLLHVDLSNNSLNGSIPALPNVTNLIKLKLDNNSFAKFEESWFLGANGTLNSFSVSFNQLEGAIPSAITDLQSMAYLNMSHNRLSGSIPPGFSKLYISTREAFTLDLSQNQLMGNIPTDFLVTDTTCPFLNLSHNRLNGSIPGTTGHANNYDCIIILDLSHNDLSGPIPGSFIKNLYSHFLWLQNNSLSGDVIDLFFGCPLVPDFETNLPIFELRLQNNLLTGDLSSISNSNCSSPNRPPNVIDLSNNNLRWSTSEANSDPITATMATLTSQKRALLEFRVGGNNFLGTSIPISCSGSTAGLEVLDLSNSGLNWEMLGASFNSSCWTSLQLLNLSNNEISGPVPEDLFSLPSLSVLSLSNNKLSGSLPAIPPNTRLFNPEIFSGNVRLCGVPLDHACPQVSIQWWVLLVTIGGSLTIAMGSCLAATWRWRVYQKRHQQDADLISTLLERDSATIIPLRDIKKATANFAESGQIGEGGFGTVYIGKLQDGTTVAIKRSKREGSDQDKEQFLNEVRILSQVNHRNLVKLLGCCLENKTAVLVFEFVSNGTVQEHLQGKMEGDRLSWEQRLNIGAQTASALNYLHTSATLPIYHRDVKSANILLTENLDAKVADFGISKLAPLQATHVSTVAIQGTMGYIDPEYYTSYQLTDKSDVFSFGVVLLELISAKPALDFTRGGEDNSLVTLATRFIDRGDLRGFIDPALVETYSDPASHARESILNVGRLAMRCVDMRSKARPTMNEVLQELQNLWVKLKGIPEDVGYSFTLNDYEDYKRTMMGLDDMITHFSFLKLSPVKTQLIVAFNCRNSLTSDPNLWEIEHVVSYKYTIHLRIIVMQIGCH